MTDTTTKADQWLDEIRGKLDQLDEALEIDQYADAYEAIKNIRARLTDIEDGMMSFLTAFLPETDDRRVDLNG